MNTDVTASELLRRALYGFTGERSGVASVDRCGTSPSPARPLVFAPPRMPDECGSGYRLRFAVLPSFKAPRWIVPLGDRHLAARGMQIYSPYARWALLAKILLISCIKTGWRGWARDRLEVVIRDFPLAALVRDVTGERTVVFALALGSPGRYRKLTIQVMRPDGEILGYIKLPLTADAAGRVRHEARMLVELRNVAAMRPHVPELLYAGEWQDGFLLFQTAGQGRPGPARFTELHGRFLESLWTLRRLEKPGNVLVEQVAARWQRAAPLLDTDWRFLGEKALAWSLRELRGTTIRCGVSHGDFAPWNTRLRDGQLLVFDWEAAAWDDPVLWDRFHFDTQVTSLARIPRASAKAVAAGDSTVHVGLLLMYLLNSASALVEEGPQGQERDLMCRQKLLMNLVRKRSL